MRILFCVAPFAVMIFCPAALLYLCRVRHRKVLRTVFALSVAVVGWGVWNGFKPPRVTEVELHYAALPPALEGYRIVQLSDLHISSIARRARLEAIVRRVNALKSDLICVTGDLVDGDVTERAEDLSPIRALQAKDGVYYVAGNHEFYWERPEWKELFKAWGLKFLANTSVSPHEGLVLGGVNDPAAGRWAEAMPLAGRVFAPEKGSEFRVLMEHRPSRAANNIRSFGVDLQLSGHTHGGIMPLADRLVARLNGGFVRGVYAIDGGYLYVSPGTGQWAGFPVRLFNPSEITVLTLRGEKGSRPREDEVPLESPDKF